MKKLLFALSLYFLCGSLYSQIYNPATVTIYGEHKNREKIDSALLYPTGCGTPVSLRSTQQKMSAFYFDSCNHRLFVYDPKLLAWDSVGGAGGVGGGGSGGIMFVDTQYHKLMTITDSTSATLKSFRMMSGGIEIIPDTTNTTISYNIYPGYLKIDGGAKFLLSSPTAYNIEDTVSYVIVQGNNTVNFPDPALFPHRGIYITVINIGAPVLFSTQGVVFSGGYIPVGLFSSIDQVLGTQTAGTGLYVSDSVVWRRIISPTYTSLVNHDGGFGSGHIIPLNPLNWDGAGNNNYLLKTITAGNGIEIVDTTDSEIQINSTIVADTSSLADVIDTTGQPNQRILLGIGNNHIGSSRYFLFDTIQRRLLVGFTNPATVNPNWKIATTGDGLFQGILQGNKLFAPGTVLTTDTSLFKPLGFNSTGGEIRRFATWGQLIKPFVDAVGTPNLQAVLVAGNIANQDIGIDANAAIIAVSHVAGGFGLAKLEIGPSDVGQLVLRAAATGSALTTATLRPDSLTAGRIYQFPNASGTLALRSDLVGFTNPMTTAWDIIVGGTGGTPTRFPVGTNGQLLQVNNAGNIVWSAGAAWNGLLLATSVSSSTPININAAPATVNFITTASSPVIYNLPAAASNTAFWFKNAGTSTMTIVRNGTNTIYTTSSQTSVVLNPGESIQLSCFGFVWYAQWQGSTAVTSFSKTDGFGIVSSVANPTTTPNHTIGIDSSSSALKAYIAQYGASMADSSLFILNQSTHKQTVSSAWIDSIKTDFIRIRHNAPDDYPLSGHTTDTYTWPFTVESIDTNATDTYNDPPFATASIKKTLRFPNPVRSVSHVALYSGIRYEVQDSANIYSLGGDLGVSGMFETEWADLNSSAEVRVKGGTIVTDVVPAVFGGHVIRSFPNPVHLRGYWAGFNTLMNNGGRNTDTVDHWVSYLASNQQPVKHFDTWTGLYVLSPTSTFVSNSWGVYVGTSNTRSLFSGQVGIGSSGLGTFTAPSFDASALLILRSTTQGFLPMSMTTTQMNAISSPAPGLHVWNTDSLVLCFYNGSAWLKYSSGVSGGGGGMADPGSNGIVVRTATNVTTNRTITGTSNEVSVSNGDGVSGNPTLSIPSTFDISGKTLTMPPTFTANSVLHTLSSVAGIIAEYSTSTSAATATPVGSSRTNDYYLTALNTAPTFSAPSGTLANGNILRIRIKDNGTARVLAWDAIYTAGTDIPLPTTTIVGKTTYVTFAYNSATPSWNCIGSVTLAFDWVDIVIALALAGAATAIGNKRRRRIAA